MKQFILALKQLNIFDIHTLQCYIWLFYEANYLALKQLSKFDTQTLQCYIWLFYEANYFST